MLLYVVRRVLLILPTLLFVSMLIFGLQQLLPGDPAVALAGEDRNPEVIAYLHQRYHLDEPLPLRYLLWLEGVAEGDLLLIVNPILIIGAQAGVEDPLLEAEIAAFQISGDGLAFGGA